MKLKPEQVMGSLFAVIGLVAGFLSVQLGANMFSYVVPLVIYAGATFGMTKVFTNKKPKWFLINGSISFFLVWLVAWIFLFNTF